MPLKLDSLLIDSLVADLVTPNIAPFIAGEAGIGKTSIVKALEDVDSDYDFKVFTIEVNTLSDKGDLAGPRLDKVEINGQQKTVQIFFPHQTLVEANEYAKANPDELVVVCGDEINRTDSDVTSAVLTLQTARRAGNLDLADNIRFVFTGNFVGNVTQLDSASLTRFSIYEVEPDAPTWLEYMKTQRRLHPFVEEVIANNPKTLLGKPVANTAATDENEALAMFGDGDEEMAQHATPRTIEGVSEWLFGVSDNYLTRLVAALTGNGIDGQSTSESYLLAILRGKTGDTEFTHKLIEVITNHLSKASTTTAVASSPAPMPQPASWRGLVAGRSLSSIQTNLVDVDDAELGGLLSYALLVPESGTKGRLGRAVIKAIVESGRLDQLEGPDLRALMARNSEINSTSLRELMQSGGPLGDQFDSFRTVFDLS